MHGLKNAGVSLDRKVLSDLAMVDPAAFSKVVQTSAAK
jgi:large subunit ribosomal protein L20